MPLDDSDEQLTYPAGRIPIILCGENVDVLPVLLVLGDVSVCSWRCRRQGLLVLCLETQATPAGCGIPTGLSIVFGVSLPVRMVVACHRLSYLVDNCLVLYLCSDLGRKMIILVCASVELLESTMFKLALTATMDVSLHVSV